MAGTGDPVPREAVPAGDVTPGPRQAEEGLAMKVAVTRAGPHAALCDLAGKRLTGRIPDRSARVRAISPA